jgi:UDP-N-acetyl-D-mannosaminuronic acid transferase (WecB/TagA/CpsF family)
MVCLNHLMANKGPALVFVGMSPSDKELWINTHLAKIRGHMAFQ